jgi:hypothetical protein
MSIPLYNVDLKSDRPEEINEVIGMITTFEGRLREFHIKIDDQEGLEFEQRLFASMSIIIRMVKDYSDRISTPIMERVDFGELIATIGEVEEKRFREITDISVRIFDRNTLTKENYLPYWEMGPTSEARRLNEIVNEFMKNADEFLDRDSDFPDEVIKVSLEFSSYMVVLLSSLIEAIRIGFYEKLINGNDEIYAEVTTLIRLGIAYISNKGLGGLSPE